MSSCLGCWGDCWRAKNWGSVEVRVGTRYSRAPSGDDWRRIGVSISVKPVNQYGTVCCIKVDRTVVMEVIADDVGDPAPELEVVC